MRVDSLPKIAYGRISDALSDYKFDGLITLSSKGTLGKIPRIAHEEGFKDVIMGVWDLHNADEVSAALSAEGADAYCIGQSGLTKRYQLDELKTMVARFKEKTRRPVAVSEVLGEYESNAELVRLGDFMFPDVHAQWHGGESPESAWNETVEADKEAAKLTSAEPKRLILLKMVSYPSAGAPGLTPATQAKFYQLAVETKRHRTDLSERVYFSFLGAFDTPWKTKANQWPLAELHTGLFTADRKPKPAVLNVQWEAHP